MIVRSLCSSPRPTICSLYPVFFLGQPSSCLVWRSLTEDRPPDRIDVFGNPGAAGQLVALSHDAQFFKFKFGQVALEGLTSHIVFLICKTVNSKSKCIMPLNMQIYNNTNRIIMVFYLLTANNSYGQLACACIFQKYALLSCLSDGFCVGLLASTNRRKLPRLRRAGAIFIPISGAVGPCSGSRSFPTLVLIRVRPRLFHQSRRFGRCPGSRSPSPSALGAATLKRLFPNRSSFPQPNPQREAVSPTASEWSHSSTNRPWGRAPGHSSDSP